MILTIIAAIVMAAAGIAGMLFLNARLKGATVATAKAEGRLAMAQVEARATTDLATQIAHEARALENIVKAKDAEIERLARLQPHYGRDKKGRFTRIAA